MKKLYLLPFILVPTLFLASCSTKDQEVQPPTSNLISSNSNSTFNFTPFNLLSETLISNPFVFDDSTLIFPNWEDNHKISFIEGDLPAKMISTTAVTDFFDYSTDSLALVGKKLYFSNGSDGHCLSSIDLITQEFKKINSNNAHNIVSSTNLVLYINKDDSNKIYIHDTLINQTKTLVSDSVGHFIINGDFVLYQNLSDNSKLYKVNLDGTQREKLTDYSVDSFAPYEGELLVVNSSDNNNLYTLNPINLTSRRLFIMNGTNLKINGDKLYFINQDNNNYLYNLDVNLETNEVTSSIVLSEGINDYYPTPTSIFVQKMSNVNNTYILTLE